MNKLLIVLALLFFPLSLRAEEPTISLADLEKEALANNPELRMAAKRAESADRRKTVAAALPDPMVGYMVQNVGSPGTWSVGVEDMSMQGLVFTQEVPFPGKLATRGRAAGRQADQQRESLRAARLRVLNDLRAAYYDYYLAFRSTAILGETKELMKNFQRIAETRYATGQGAQQDVIRAQLEVSMLLDRIAEQDLKKSIAASRISSLAGRDPRQPLPGPTALARTLPALAADALSARALDHSPMLRGRKLMVDQSREELSLSRREFLPDMVVSGGWFTRGEKSDVWQASVMFRIPLYFWNKSAAVDAAAADLSAAEYEYETERLATLARMRDLAGMATTSEHHLHLYETGIIPQARLALQAATTNYQVGKADFLALLESENTLLKYQLMEQEELVNLNRTLAMISEQTGEEHE